MAAALSVKVVFVGIVAMRAPAGILVPLTNMPVTKFAVLGHVTVVLAFVVELPVRGIEYHAVTVCPEPVALALAFKVKLVLLFTAATVAPVGMLLPLTFMPTARPVVLAHVTPALPDVVVTEVRETGFKDVVETNTVPAGTFGSSTGMPGVRPVELVTVINGDPETVLAFARGSDVLTNVKVWPLAEEEAF